MLKLLTFFLLLLASTPLIWAEEEAAAEAAAAEPSQNDTVTEEEPEPIVLYPSPYVSTFFVFPSSTERAFTLGNPIDLVFGLSNQGDVDINVTVGYASLRYPPDWRYIIQNYTGMLYNFVVKPKEEASFLYSFMPDPLLEPREFGIQAEVEYFDVNGNWSSVVFNDTIVVLESGEGVDAQTLFTYIGIIGVAALVLFSAHKFVKNKEKRARRRTFETGTSKVTEVDPDWLEGTHAIPTKKAAKSASPKLSKKKTQ